MAVKLVVVAGKSSVIGITLRSRFRPFRLRIDGHGVAVLAKRGAMAVVELPEGKFDLTVTEVVPGISEEASFWADPSVRAGASRRPRNLLHSFPRGQPASGECSVEFGPNTANVFALCCFFYPKTHGEGGSYSYYEFRQEHDLPHIDEIVPIAYSELVRDPGAENR